MTLQPNNVFHQLVGWGFSGQTKLRVSGVECKSRGNAVALTPGGFAAVAVDESGQAKETNIGGGSIECADFVCEDLTCQNITILGSNTRIDSTIIKATDPIVQIGYGTSDLRHEGNYDNHDRGFDMLYKININGNNVEKRAFMGLDVLTETFTIYTKEGQTEHPINFEGTRGDFVANKIEAEGHIYAFKGISAPNINTMKGEIFSIKCDIDNLYIDTTTRINYVQGQMIGTDLRISALSETLDANDTAAKVRINTVQGSLNSLDKALDIINTSMVKNTNSLRGDYISAINAIERVQNSNTERLNYVQGETIKNNTLLKDQNSIFRNLTNTMMGSLVASSNQIDNMEYYLKTELNSVHGKLNNTVPLTGGYMTGSLDIRSTDITDNNTGLKLSHNNGIAFIDYGGSIGNLHFRSTNSSKRITLLNNGRVGISNVSPSYKLDVNGDIRCNDELYVTNKVGIGTVLPGTLLQLTGSQPYLTLKNNTNTHTNGSCESKILFEDHDNVNLAKIEVSHEGDDDDHRGRMKFFTNTGSSVHERLTINNDGKVGIGVSDPSSNLDVNGTLCLRYGNATGNSATQIRFGRLGTRDYANSITTRHNTSNSDQTAIDFYCWQTTDSSTTVGTKHVMSLTGGGNVGIGITEPEDKLHIKGGNLIIENGGSNTMDNKIVFMEDYSSNQNFFIGTDLAEANSDDQRMFFGYKNGANPTSDNSLMVLRGDGNVGIGTTAPETEFHLYGSPLIHHSYHHPASGDGAGWYRIGTWEGVNPGGGSRLKISLLGQSGYNTHKHHRGGETIIYASMNNSDVSSSANVSGFIHAYGEHIIASAKFSQVGSDRYKYYIYVKFRGYTKSSIKYECGNTTKFTPDYPFLVLSTAEVTALESASDGQTLETAIFTHVVDNDGNVGIGTTSPSETLEVNGNIKADTAFIGEIYSNDYAGFSYSTMNTIGNYAILQNSVGDTFVNAASGKTIAFRIDNNNKMFMNSSGFVGIGGITNPPHALVVGPADTNGNPPNGSGAFSVRLGHAHIGNFGHNSGTHDQHNWVGFGWWNFGRAAGSTTGSNDYSVLQNGLGETRVNSSSGRNLKLCQNNSHKLIIDGSTGNVQLNFLRAIGTSPLTICRGDRNSSSTSGLFRFGNNGHHIDCYRQDTYGGRSLYINYYAAQKIIAPQYDIGSVSDRRIKENFEEIKDDEALQKLRLLNPLTYTYKATPDHERVYGFIAQEVKEVLPHAVNTDKLCIPNIVARASISIITMPSSQDENDIDGIVEEEVGGIITILDSSKNTDSLVVGCQALIRYLSCESQANVIVKNVIDSKTFEFEYGDGLAPLEKELLSGIDTHGNPYTNELILLGTEVDDFHILSKTAIWTVCCAALQEVDRQLQAEKAKTATLETKTATLQGIVASQQVIINELLSRVTALETV